MPNAKKAMPVNGKNWWGGTKWITLLLFIYNTILGYVIIELTAKSGSGLGGVLLLLIIAVDYIIIFLFAIHVSGMMEKRKQLAARRSRGT